MATFNMTLRQKKVLYILQYASEPITGADLAEQFHVSSRTIRNDIQMINDILKPYFASIIPLKSRGYTFYAQDFKKIEELNRIDNAFLSKDNRVRYLAFKLCLSNSAVNLYDLEDEIFVSRTTLKHDLDELESRFVRGEPHIALLHDKDNIRFEQNEKKRREILNSLYFEGWNYQSKGNAYYSLEYLKDEVLDYVMDTVSGLLDHFRIQMEDPSLVSLHIAVAVMCQRVMDGYPLAEEPFCSKESDIAAMNAAREIFSRLEMHFNCQFNEAERKSIYQRIESGHLMDAKKLNFQTVKDYFDEDVLHAANRYLTRICDFFHLDLSRDEDFYITLLQYIQFIKRPVAILNSQFNGELIKSRFAAEYEMALLFQDIAIQDLGFYLTEVELLYLADLIEGALEFLLNLNDNYKINTVICSHMNLPGFWALKRQLLSSFDSFLNITALLPVSAKNIFDFRHTDLIVSTVRKEYTDLPSVDTLIISPILTDSDRERISAYIHEKRIRSLCRLPFSMETLLENAFWHEQAKIDTPAEIIKIMSDDFIKNGIADNRFRDSILQRESQSTYAAMPEILFLHSFAPAKKTKLSIMLLEHRVFWKSYRFRVIIMASFAPGEYELIFPLLYHFYNKRCNSDLLKTISSKEDLLNYLN